MLRRLGTLVAKYLAGPFLRKRVFKLVTLMSWNIPNEMNRRMLIGSSWPFQRSYQFDQSEGILTILTNQRAIWPIRGQFDQSEANLTILTNQRATWPIRNQSEANLTIQNPIWPIWPIRSWFEHFDQSEDNLTNLTNQKLIWPIWPIWSHFEHFD